MARHYIQSPGKPILTLSSHERDWLVRRHPSGASGRWAVTKETDKGFALRPIESGGHALDGQDLETSTKKRATSYDRPASLNPGRSDDLVWVAIGVQVGEEKTRKKVKPAADKSSTDEA